MRKQSAAVGCWMCSVYFPGCHTASVETAKGIAGSSGTPAFSFFFFEYTAVCLCHPEVFLRHRHHRPGITSQKRSADSVPNASGGCENDPGDVQAGDKHLSRMWKLVCFSSHQNLFFVSVNLEIGLDVCRATLDSRQNVILTSSDYD